MRDGAKDNKTSIQSIERATDILPMFSKAHPRLTLTEISSRLQLSRATGHRYASALRNAGLLRYDEATATYTVGTLVLELANTAIAGLPVIAAAEPLLARLVEETGETAMLSIWNGESPVVVRVNDNSARYITVRVREGYRLGPVSAQARIFMAHGMELRAEEGRPHALTDSERAEVLAASVQIHTNASIGVRTIAAPVYLGDELAAVLAVIGTTSTVPDHADSPLVRSLLRAAGDVSRGLPRGEQSKPTGAAS